MHGLDHKEMGWGLIRIVCCGHNPDSRRCLVEYCGRSNGEALQRAEKPLAEGTMHPCEGKEEIKND